MPKKPSGKSRTPSLLPKSRLFALNQTKLILIVVFATLAAAAACLVVWYLTFTRTHLPPNIEVSGVDISWMPYSKAERTLRSQLGTPPGHQVVVRVDDIEVASNSAELGAYYDVADTLNHFKASSQETQPVPRFKWLLNQLFSETITQAPLRYDDEKMNELLTALNAKVAYSDEIPQATLATQGSPQTLTINPGKMGRTLDVETTIYSLLNSPLTEKVEIVAHIASTGAELSETQVEEAQALAEKYIGKEVQLTSDWNTFILTDQELVELLAFPTGLQKTILDEHLENWRENIARPAQEPALEYDPETLRVTKFDPPRDGLKLDEALTQTMVSEEMTSIGQLSDEDNESETTREITLPVVRTPPSRSLAETNELGIIERIGFGESHYKGSIPNRIHNVSLSTGRISGQIIPPGAEYSFNRALGPVSSSTGYRSAYVIKNGMTTLGDGGGVCQTSTTLFRTALDAGLEITRRLPHSYRVSYYEQDQKPGIDATVYVGDTDLRFRNDTDHHILLFGEADSNNQYMYIEMYGTSDGRSTEIVDHKTWNARPAPPPQYIPDSSLAPGQLRQIDWAAPGINASFTNVIRDAEGNEVRRDTYASNYRPWAAKFLRGE